MEWNLVRIGIDSFWVPGLAVLFSFGELGDDGDA